MAATVKEMIEAIRNDKLVGRGTCTGIDEGRSDDDLIWILDLDKLSTVKQAVKAARDSEELDLEMATNQRFGEDSDPELLALKAFRQARKDEKKKIKAEKAWEKYMKGS
jgi:hypothetical protein